MYINNYYLIFFKYLSLIIFFSGFFSCLFFEKFGYIPFYSSFFLLFILFNSYKKEKNKFDLLQPITAILISFFIGTLLRSYFYVSDEVTAVKKIMLQLGDYDNMFVGLIYIFIAFLFFNFGYHSIKKTNLKFGFFNKIENRLIVGNKLILISLFIIICSCIFFYIYILKMGIAYDDISTLKNLSKKRALKLGDGQFASLSYLNFGVNILQPLYYIILYFLLTKKKSFFSLHGCLLLITFSILLSFNIINSHRGTPIVMLLTTVFIIKYYTKKIPRFLFLFCIFFSTLLLISMTYLRNNNELIKKIDEVNKNPLTIVVGSLNFLGVTKTSYIINHAKKNNEYLLGKSLFLWTVAPIPREYWKNKPEISIGKDIAKNIYKKRDDNIAGGGVPPGFIAELYLNFGLVGICTGKFIFGLICSYSYHLIFQKKSLFRFIVYLTIFFPSIFYLIGGDLSRIIIKFIFLLIIFSMLLFLMSKKKQILIK